MAIPEDLPPEAVRRITEAADQLFEEAGHATLPNVDAVRRRAHANMNHVTLVMRSWRQQHAPRATADEHVPPETLRQLGEQFMSRVWREARHLAEGQLSKVREAWDIERGELEEVRDQLAGAFDAQTGELDHVSKQYADLQAHHERLSSDHARMTRQLETVEAERVEQQRVHAQALEESAGLRKLLQSALAAHERQARQWQDQLAAYATAAERHHAEQALRNDELHQLRQEATVLRASLSDKRNTQSATAAAIRPGRSKHSAARQDAPPAIERKK